MVEIETISPGMFPAPDSCHDGRCDSVRLSDLFRTIRLLAQVTIAKIPQYPQLQAVVGQAQGLDTRGRRKAFILVRILCVARLVDIVATDPPNHEFTRNLEHFLRIRFQLGHGNGFVVKAFNNELFL